MAKRNSGGKQTKTQTTNAAAGNTATANQGADTSGNDAMEQRVVAFAEQLGRIVGTMQAKTEGWMDRDALNKQIAGVRDSAAELLEQLSDGVTSLTNSASKATGMGGADAPAAAGASKPRSRGAVDAPGKKHRKPAPRDMRAIAADAKSANMRSAKGSMKTTKKRGRG
ncbi:MAG: hypothetical protein JWL71_3944 [Acidobacteria bacterium]|nr:hypothetical protein [Acidobacteriota bacterium]